MELQASEARVKVDTQINNFMLMMNSLEGEWQKMEDARVKRENELEAQRVCFEKAGETMAFLTTTVQDLQAQVDHLKVVLDRVVDHVPKSAKKVRGSCRRPLSPLSLSLSSLFSAPLSSLSLLSPLLLLLKQLYAKHVAVRHGT